MGEDGVGSDDYDPNADPKADPRERRRIRYEYRELIAETQSKAQNNAIYLILSLCYYAIFYAYDLTMYLRYVLVRQQPPKDTLHKRAIVANLSVMIILLFSDINLQKTDMILSSLSRLGCTRLWTKLTIYLKEVRRISERQSMIRSFAC